MPLTPGDVANKLFSKALRGYDMEEVDAFLDEVQAELARLLTENQELQQRAYQTASAPPAPVATAAPAVAAPVSVPAAAPVSAPATGESQEAALRTLLMAQRTADQTVAEARAEADQKIAAAQDQANQLVGGAQLKAQQLEQEINVRTSAALGDLEGRRRELEARIEDLRAFEREYRLRLKAYLESQLRDLDGREGGQPTPPAGPPPAAQPSPARPTANPAASPPTAPTAPTPFASQAAPQASPPVPMAPRPTVPTPTPTPAPAPAPVASPGEVSPAGPAAGHAAAVPSSPSGFSMNDLNEDLATGTHDLDEHRGGVSPTGRLRELFSDDGSPREAPPALRSVPPLSTTEPEPVGPFTVVRPASREQLDDGPEPPAPAH